MGFRVNAVCPGWVKTEMDVVDQAASGAYNDADIEGVNPMGRFATPEDIAQAILFSGGAGAEWVCQWAYAGGRWWMDQRWKLAEFADEEAIERFRCAANFRR